MDGGAWWAAVHGVDKSQTRLSDFPFTFHFHALEKEMATHSSVLAWRIPGNVEPGGLPSMGSHRVGHDWSDLPAAAAASVLITWIVVGKAGVISGFLFKGLKVGTTLVCLGRPAIYPPQTSLFWSAALCSVWPLRLCAFTWRSSFSLCWKQKAVFKLGREISDGKWL